MRNAFLIIFVVTSMPFYLLSAENDQAKLVRNFYDGKTFEKENYLPKGFEITGQAIGDLDQDSIDDLAIIIKRSSMESSKENHQKPEDTEDFGFEPQFVIILKGTKEKKWSTWMIGLNHFLEAMPNQMEKNGFRGMKISKGVLSTESDFAMSAGGWTAGGCVQKWRNGKKGFQLIGLTVTTINRGCACGTTVDKNFLTKKSITKSDEGPNGEQLEKEIVKKDDLKIDDIFWDDFNYDKYCLDQK